MNRVKTEIPATLEEAAQAGRVCMDVKKDGQFCYHIYLEPDFAKLPEAVEPLNMKESCALWQTVPQQSFMVRN